MSWSSNFTFHQSARSRCSLAAGERAPSTHSERSTVDWCAIAPEGLWTFVFKAVRVLCADPMISRRALLALGAGSLVTAGLAGAQTPKKTARVGLL
jgi:hypothetical protein